MDTTLIYENIVDVRGLKERLESDKIYQWFKDAISPFEGDSIKKAYLTGSYIVHIISGTEYNDVDVFCEISLSDDQEKIIKEISDSIYGKNNWTNLYDKINETYINAISVIEGYVPGIDEKAQLIFTSYKPGFDFTLCEIFVDTDLDITGNGLNRYILEAYSDFVDNARTQTRLIKYMKKGFKTNVETIDRFMIYEFGSTVNWDRPFYEEQGGYATMLYELATQQEKEELINGLSPAQVARMRMWQENNPNYFDEYRELYKRYKNDKDIGYF